MDYAKAFAKALQALKDEGRYRVFADIRRDARQLSGRQPFRSRRSAAHHRVVLQRLPRDGAEPRRARRHAWGLDEAGAGSGGTRNISGTSHYHVELERELADLHGKEAALLFTSAYVANDTTLATLQKLLPGSIIFSDEQNHASMIAGIRNGGGEKRIWRNNDVGRSRGQARLGRSRPAQDHRLRVRLLHGRPHCARSAPSATWPSAMAPSPTSTRCTPSGSTGRAAGVSPSATGVMHRVDIINGTLAKGFGIMGGYIAAGADICRCHPLVRSGFHLHHLARPGDRGRRGCQHPAPEDQPRRARASSGAGADAEAAPAGGGPAGDGESRATSCRSWSATRC